MADENMKSLAEIKIDKDGLYREESFTDLKAGTIQRLVPVKADGSDDTDRPTLYSGMAQLMGPGGQPLPVSAALEVETLDAAIEAFPAAITKAVERLVAEIRELERQQASRIVTPDAMGGGLGGLPGGPGGIKLK